MQLIVRLVLLAWRERGGWGAASEGFWESYGTAWTLERLWRKNLPGLSLAPVARARKAAALSWSWCTAWTEGKYGRSVVRMDNSPS